MITNKNMKNKVIHLFLYALTWGWPPVIHMLKLLLSNLNFRFVKIRKVISVKNSCKMVFEPNLLHTIKTVHKAVFHQSGSY